MSYCLCSINLDFKTEEIAFTIFKIMKKRYILITAIVILLISIIIIKFNNKVNVANVYENHTVAANSVIKNDTTNLAKNNVDFERLTAYVDRLDFKIKILSALNDEEYEAYNKELATLEEEINKNLNLIKKNEELFNNTISSFEDLDNKINKYFSEIGIIIKNGELQSINVEVIDIDDKNYIVKDANKEYKVSKEIYSEKELKIGNEIVVYYNDIYYYTDENIIVGFYIK